MCSQVWLNPSHFKKGGIVLAPVFCPLFTISFLVSCPPVCFVSSAASLISISLVSFPVFSNPLVSSIVRLMKSTWAETWDFWSRVSLHILQSVTKTFYRPTMNTKYYSVFRNHQIPNIEYYSVLRESKYRIPNTTRYREYPNAKYK